MLRVMIVGFMAVMLCVADAGRAEIINVNTRVEGPTMFDDNILEIVDGFAPPTVVDVVTPAVIPAFIRVRGQSQLNVFGGVLGAGLDAFDESTIRIYGGEIAQGEDLDAHDNSRIEIWSGMIGTGGDTLHARDNATILVHGGKIRKRPWVSSSGTIEFFGRELKLQSDTSNADAFVLSGILADNTPINVGVTVRDNGSVVVHNIPEPTSIGLFGWGMMLLATQRYFVRHD